MSAELLFVVLLGACVAYCYSRRAKPDRSSIPQPPATQSVSALPAQNEPEIDTFLQQVASEKSQADAVVATAVQQHERDLEQRFADDVKLKERLSQFARTYELDKALIALWEEIEHYPAWSSRDDFKKWNKLGVTGINGSSEGDTKSVEFTRGDQRFKVKERAWNGMEGEFYADLFFFEDDDEVFAIGCSSDYGEYGESYRCLNVAAFKKRGNWSTVLLEYYEQIRIGRNKLSAEFKYFGADEIKSRFQE